MSKPKEIKYIEFLISTHGEEKAIEILKKKPPKERQELIQKIRWWQAKKLTTNKEVWKRYEDKLARVSSTQYKKKLRKKGWLR